MSEIASARINSFAPEQANVQPSEESIFVLTSNQLQDIITQAVEKAILPLQDRIDSLEATVANQDEKIAALESTQDTQADNQLIQLRLIADLRKKDPGKIEIARAEKIEKYLEARPDHKATFETLKGCLGVNKDRLLEAIKTLQTTHPGQFVIFKDPSDKRKRSIKMLPK